MLAVQALQDVLSLAQERFDQDIWDDNHPHEQALKICNDILTVAVPLARFRCFVTIEKIGARSKLGLGDFAVSGLDISSIKNGLIGLSTESVTVYIQLWEHREEGKFDMLSGYQGLTKTLGFRNWLKDIDRHNEQRPTNHIQVNDGAPTQNA